MADGGTTQTGIVITGEDESGPAFGSASKNAELLNKKLGSAGIGGTLKSMPEQFGKASTALLLFQNSTAQMSGKVADAANKLTAVVGLVATGGPIGVGLAAITLATAGAASAWETYTMASRNAEAAQRTLNSVFEAQEARVGDQVSRTKDAEKAIRDFGKTASQVAIEDMAKLIESSRKHTEELSDERIALQFTGRAFREMTADQQKQYELYGQIIERTNRLNDSRQRELDAMRKMQEMQKETERQQQRENEAKARAIARRNDSFAALKQERQALEAAAAAVSITASGYEYQIQKIEEAITAIEAKNSLTKSEAESLAQLVDVSKAAREMEKQDIEDVAKAEESRKQARIKAIKEEFAELEILAAQKDWEREKENEILAEKREANRLLHEELKAQREEEIRSTIGTATQLGHAFGQAFAAIATGAESVKEALKGLASTLVDTMLSAIEQVIIAEAAKAAAGAASGMFSIPIIGPALAAGAAATAFAFVKGLLSLLPKAAFGGMVTGGVPGVDSVPVLTQHGEGILQRGQTAVLKRLADRLESLEARGGMSPVSATQVVGGSQVTNVVNFNSVHPPTSAEAMRAQRASMKQQHQLQMLGVGV